MVLCSALDKPRSTIAQVEELVEVDREEVQDKGIHSANPTELLDQVVINMASFIF